MILPRIDHARREFQRQPSQVGRAGILQRLRNFHDLERITYRITERLAHVSDQRLYAFVHAPSDADHHLRKPACFDLLLHERARAHFDVKH